MKLATLTITSLLIAGSCVSSAQLQHARRQTKPTFNTQALAATQSDLIAAISSMTSALPIYDGNRVRSIHLAHRALVMIDRQLSGAQTQQRKAPMVRDHIASKTAHSKYTPQQIAASQAAMNQGLQSLNKAASDYQVAAGNTNAKGPVAAFGFINQSIREANAAIAIHNH